jgi:O-antigen polymerase
MKKGSAHIVTLVQLLILCAMFSTAFMVSRGFFNDLLTAKQYGLEICALFGTVLLALTLPFKRQIKFTKADGLVVLFVLWHLLSELLSDAPYSSYSKTLFNTLLWSLIYVFVRQQTAGSLFQWGGVSLFLVIALGQAGLGLMQLYGFSPSHHALFSITGTFHNPGPFSGFVASALPMALGIIAFPTLVMDASKAITPNHPVLLSVFIRCLAWITLIAAALILPPAQSRAAWIAGTVGCLFVLTCHPVFKSFWHSLKNKLHSFSIPMRVLCLLAILLVVLVIGFGLYTMKKGSADGRVLIWQVTSQLIKQKPITGHGSGAFAALYMNEQANWFEAGKGTEVQSMVAGSPEAPFNEVLKLWLEKGLLAVVLAGALLYFLLRDQSFPAASSWQTDQDQEQSFAGPVPYIGVKGSLLALLVFSFFSYPFAISSFVLQLVFLAALLAGASKTILTIKGRKTILLTLPFAMAILVVSIHYYPHRKEHYQAMSVWHEAERWYNFRAYQAAVETYEEALPELNTNGLFLQMYGKALSMNEQHEESNKVLILAQKHFSSQIIQNTLGDNHKALGNFEAAEKAYRKSSLMIPSSLLPKYLSAILFTESNQLNKARLLAEDILNSPIKVESSATREIMREMKKILDTDE